MPFWQPRSAGFAERISVMWLRSSTAEPPPSTRTPVRTCVEQKSASGSGPAIVKSRR